MAAETSSSRSQASMPPPPSSQAPPPCPSSPPVNPNPNTHGAGNVYNELIIQNGLNFEKSGTPTRILFYHHDNHWEDFRGEVLETLRSSFSERRPMLLLEIEGVKYAIDFISMVQVNMKHGSQRSIAWIDEKDRAFFPKSVLNMQVDKEEVKDVDGNEESDKGSKRVKLALNVVPANANPEHPEFPHTRKLSKDDPEYTYFSNLFISSITKFDPMAVVTDIHELRVLEPEVNPRWVGFERQVRASERVRGDANVTHAWYTTTKEGVAAILSHGFSLPPQSSPLPQALKNGVFLASLNAPRYSAIQSQVEKDGEKHVILCRVALGNVEMLHLEFEQDSPSREEYDTASDDPKSPKWYAVWSYDINTRIFPLYVITCKTTAIHSVHLPARYGGSNPFTLQRLTLKIKKSIPFSDVEVLDRLFDALKTQSVSKDDFKKMLKALVGDHNLSTAINEMRGNK